MSAIRRTHPELWFIAALALSFFLLLPQHRLSRPIEMTVGAALGVLATYMLIRGRYDAAEQTAGAPGPLRGFGTLIAKMSPTILLMSVFPLVIATLNSTDIGGVPAERVLLAVSVSVPWLSQAVCIAFYRHFWDLEDQRKTYQVAPRMFSRWPEIMVATLPVSVIFTAAVALITDWPLITLAYVGAGMLLHSLFAQSLVLVNQTRNDTLWVVSWVLYALVVLVAPTFWLLAPVFGMLPNILIVALRGARIHRPSWAELGQHLVDTGRGFLTGSVLWADKFVLLLVVGTVYDIYVLYIALIPAVLAYSYYFAQLAPNFDLAVEKADAAIHHGTMKELRGRTSLVADVVAHAVARTVAVAWVIALTLAVVIQLIPGAPRLPLELVVVPIGALVVTILSYQLEYIGHRGTASLLSGLHLLAVLSLAVIPVPLALPLVLAADVAISIAGYVRIRQVWGSMPYQMFWRFATQW